MTKKGQSEVYCVLFIIGLDEVVVLSELVMFPPIVAFVPPVMLVSSVLIFCAFAEFRPIIAIMPLSPVQTATCYYYCYPRYQSIFAHRHNHFELSLLYKN